MTSPGKPYSTFSSSSTITLEWTMQSSTNVAFSHFNVKYQIDGERRWRSINTSTKECCIVVSELKDDTYYIFKVRCVMDDDTESPFGETSDAIRTAIGGNDRNEGRDDHTAVTPGKPYGLEATATSILLGWDQPKISTKYDHFEVKYKQKGVSLWQSLTSKEPTLLLTDLKSNAKYLFRVRIVFEDGTEGPFSVVSDEIMTLQSLAGILKQSATKVDSRMPEIYTKRISRGVPEIYQIPVKREQVNNPKTMTRKCIILKESPDESKPQKTIMVMGATGSGKSTLIEGMLNHIIGASWDDNARFKLINVKGIERNKHGKESESQTEWITCYSLNWMPGFQIDFNLNIIDTPGFGDTRGILRDKKLVDQIREFFTCPGDHGVDEINAVCFVTQAPLCRLTPTVRYIFDSILSLFGKDFEKNIYVLITFADGKEPPVINALKAANVPFEQIFVFNNSALFVNPAKSVNGPLFWKMVKRSFDDFFIALRKSPPRSLQLTTDVLRKRQELELDILGIQCQLKEGTERLAILRQEEEILHQHERLIEANQNFMYKTKRHEAKDDAGQKLSVVEKIKTASNELRLENLKLVNQVRKSVSELQKIALWANPLSEIQYIELLIQTELDEKKIGFEDRINVLEEMKREAIALQNITMDTFTFPGEE